MYKCMRVASRYPPLYVSVQPTLSVLSMYPTSGLAHGSTLVFFTGRHFKNITSMLCRLGAAGNLVTPVWVESNMVRVSVCVRVSFLLGRLMVVR
jgi:hypothetical protein